MLEEHGLQMKGDIIAANSYIMMLGMHTILSKLKFGYNIDRWDKFIPNLIMCYKCKNIGTMRLNDMEKVYVENVDRKILSNPQLKAQFYTGVQTVV